jgi:hypothetical protein
VLKSTQLVDGIIIENQFGLGRRLYIAKKTKTTVIPEHLGMYAHKTGSGLERIGRWASFGHAN